MNSAPAGQLPPISLSGSLGTQSFFQLHSSLLIGGFVTLLVVIGSSLLYYFYGRKKSTPSNVKGAIAQKSADVKNRSATLGKKRAAKKVHGGKDISGRHIRKTKKHKVHRKRKDASGAVIEHFEDDGELKLGNLQPFTVKQAGFLGPIEEGVFDVKQGILESLQSGVRSFVFQIDYLEDDSKDPSLFPKAHEPCLLYRNNQGVLTSLNAGSIKNASESIAQYAFNPSVMDSEDPILIILYGVRAPDRVQNPTEYLDYCSKIAVGLKPLAPKHLGQTENGDYHRQALQDHIFNMPMSSFEKKVIIMSTFDTSLFRKSSKAYKPAEDLDFWTNVHIMKENDSDDLGVTVVESIKTPAPALIYSLESLQALSDLEKAAWATRNKDFFTIVKMDNEKNPTVAETKVLIDTLGVNVVPIDLFSFDMEATQRLSGLWDTAWREKAVALQT